MFFLPRVLSTPFSSTLPGELLPQTREVSGKPIDSVDGVQGMGPQGFTALPVLLLHLCLPSSP